MNQREKLVEFFRNHGGRATLSQLLDAGFYKLTARVSDMRKLGYKVTCLKDHSNPGRNLYTVVEWVTPKMRFDDNGHAVFL